MGLFGGSLTSCRCGYAIQKLFGESHVVVVKLNRRDLLVLAEEVTG